MMGQLFDRWVDNTSGAGIRRWAFGANALVLAGLVYLLVR